MAHTHPLEVTYRPLSVVRVNRHNARTHSKRQIAQIASSISHFGFTNPVLVDEEGQLIAGHGRLKAAQELALDSVPTIELRGLSKTEKRALMLADNKLALNAGWDTDQLKIELESLQKIDIDFQLDITGFSTGEIDVIVNPANVDPDDEVIPAMPESSFVQPGDIFELGPHRVGCGDCRDASFLEKLVGETSKVDAAFLDPPYNVVIRGNASPSKRHGEFAMASGEMNDEQFQSFLRASLSACASVTRDGGVHFVCMDWRHMDALATAGKSIYSQLLNLCVWNKSSAGMGSLYRSKHELVFVYKVGRSPSFNAVQLGKYGRNRTNVWDYTSANSPRGSRRADLELHPTVKPVAMVTDAICDVTKQGELVLDAFLGSGTSLIAAERANRRFVGCDIDPRYVQIALERWRDMTGIEPKLLPVKEIAHA